MNNIPLDGFPLFPKQGGKAVLFSDFDKQRMREFRKVVQADNGISLVRSDVSQWCDAGQAHIENRLPDFIIVSIVFGIEIILGKIILKIPTFLMLLCEKRHH
ncbi:MAG: hypothetical protein J5701_06705 [Bacteroidales bacterium]|nr:hypothetical protein [Bacteroidales bacterium]